MLSERVESPRPAFFSPARETPTNRFTDEPLNEARRRAERVITEDSFFDVRGARVPKSSIGTAIEEFDEEVNQLYQINRLLCRTFAITLAIDFNHLFIIVLKRAPQ